MTDLTRLADPNDYLLIALLAGTKTSPSSRLPPPEPKPEPWEIAQDEKSQKRAIAALVNCVFSVVGVGAAAWWASKNAGWKDEWVIHPLPASAFVSHSFCTSLAGTRLIRGRYRSSSCRRWDLLHTYIQTRCCCCVQEDTARARGRTTASQIRERNPKGEKS